MRRRIGGALAAVGLCWVVAASCGGDDSTTPDSSVGLAGRGEFCGTVQGCAAELVCCGSVCDIGVNRSVLGESGGTLACPECSDSDQCDAGECCMIPSSGDAADAGLGLCAPCGMAASSSSASSSASSGSGGAGGQGGSGSGAGGSSPVATHTVLSGNPVIDGNGCLVASGMDVEPVTIALTGVVSGGVTVTVEGTMTPQASGGLDGVSYVEVCSGGTLENDAVTGCVRTRSEHNAVAGTGAVLIYNSGGTTTVTDSWVPTTMNHAFVHNTSANPANQSVSVQLAIDGAMAASAGAGSLGVATGDAVSVKFAQATVCSIIVSQ